MRKAISILALILIFAFDALTGLLFLAFLVTK